MKVQAIKLNRDGYSRAIQHNKQVKKTTRHAARKLRHDTKLALQTGKEPPITATGGERY
jgi:hypothetical protein